MTAHELIVTIARMTTEGEADDAGNPMSGDDACAALSSVIEQARKVLAAPRAPRYFAVYIAAPHDTNGNPRRGWYVHDLADRNAPPTWCEEGYRGSTAVAYDVAAALDMPTATWRDVAAVRELVRESGRIDVTPGEYRAARKLPRFGAVGGAK